MTMQSELVSIIMPVKNASPWLQACVDSILNQTYKNWELIAIDDGSSDESFQLLKEAEAADHRIKTTRSPGRGIVDALIAALELSNGTLVTRMDADDIMPRQKLEWFVSAYLSQPGSIVTGLVNYFSSKEISAGYKEYERWLNARIADHDHWKWIYRECVIASANWLTSREHVVIDKDVYPEDYHMVLNWYTKQVPIVGIDKVTHLWREHPKRTSRNSKHYQQQAFFDLKLGHFLSNERDASRTLMVMGKNKKAKLIGRFLKSKKEPFVQVDLEHLYRFAEVENPQVLVAVFPEITVRNGISEFLEGFGIEMGRDWWWV